MGVKQPEALRLADEMDKECADLWDKDAIQDELRRLHEVNQELLDSFAEILAVKFSNWSDGEMREIARAAIAKATGENT